MSKERQIVSSMETISMPDLRTFVGVAHAGGITRAGRALGVPKAAVSKALARLERQLGVRLFERSTRRIAITPAGILVQRRAEGLLADVESLLSDVRSHERDVRGTLSVAAPPEFGVWLTERVFPSWMQMHPQVALTLKLDYGFHDLFDPSIDLAFRIGAVRDESLVARAIGSFVRVLVASPALASRVRRARLADLARLPCLAFDDSETRSSWTVTDGTRERAVDVSGRFGARSYPALLAAARAGLGIAFLPEFVVAPFVARRELVRVLPPLRSAPITIWLLHRVGQMRVRRVASFVEHVAAHAGELPSFGSSNRKKASAAPEHAIERAPRDAERPGRRGIRARGSRGRC